MKFVVLGAGKMGRAAVHDLVQLPGVEEVVVADRDEELAATVARDYGQGRARAVALDVSDQGSLRDVLAPASAVLGAISYKFNEQIARVCIAVGAHYVDLGGNNDVVKAQFALSDAAEAASVAIVPDCGLAPGLVSVLAARCLELQPSADSIRLRVGGLPLHPKPPYNYQIVFSVEGLVNEYKEPTLCLRSGQVVTVPSLDELETLEFPAPFSRLEAFTTSGGASTLPYTMRGKVRNLDYKTIRYPGHCHLIRALFALGLADDTEQEIGGIPVRPRQVLEHQMLRNLQGEGPDVVLLLVEAEGRSGRVGFRLVDTYDDRTDLSAMARCTAFPATVIMHMLASGVITDRGTLHQETSIPPGPFIEALRRRGLEVREERGTAGGGENITLW